MNFHSLKEDFLLPQTDYIRFYQRFCDYDILYTLTIPKGISTNKGNRFRNYKPINLTTVKTADNCRFEFVINHAVFKMIVWAMVFHFKFRTS